MISYRGLSDKDYNMAGNIAAFIFLGLGLANWILLAPRMTLLICIFLPVSLLFFMRAAYGSWNFMCDYPEEYNNAT